MALSVSQFGSAIFFDANVNVTATALTDTNDGFNATKVAANQDTSINGAGAAGATYYGTSLTFVSATAMTLGTPVSTNVTAAVWCWGSTKFDTNGTQTSYRLYNEQSAIVAGDAIIIMACSFNAAAGNPTIADTQGNTYELVQSVSNADGKQWTWLVRSAKSASAIGANVVTLTPAAAVDIIEVGYAIATGSPLGWVLDKPASNSPTQAVSGTSVGGACPTGSFNTSSPNEVVFAFTLVNSSVSSAGPGTTSTINPNSDCAEYKVFTTLQTGITMTVTQSTATAIYLISSIGIFPASAPQVPDPMPPAKGYYGAASQWTTFVSPPAAATVVPSPSYPAGNAGAYYPLSSSATSRRIDPASFQPNPQAVYPQAFSLGMAAAAAFMQPTPFVSPPAAATVVPSPSYPTGNAGAYYPPSSQPTPFVAPPTFIPSPWFELARQPAPRLPGSRGGATNIPANPSTFQPNPQAPFPTAWSSGAYTSSWAGFFIPTPPAVNPTASSLQRHPDQWHAGGDFVTPKWVNPALLQPNPSAVFLTPYSSGAYVSSWAGSFIPTPPAVNPTASSLQRHPDQWHLGGDFATSQRIDPAGFQPVPMAVYLTPWSAGTYASSWASPFVPAPPAVNPTAISLQRHPDQWHAGGDFATSRRIDPALFQPNPSAAFVTPWSAGAYTSSWASSFVPAPPTVNPSAISLQRHPDQWHSGGDFVTPQWINPALLRPNPSAVYSTAWSSGSYAQSSAGVFVPAPPPPPPVTAPPPSFGGGMIAHFRVRQWYGVEPTVEVETLEELARRLARQRSKS